MPKREMLINYATGEECRIAIVEDSRLEELYQERASSESHVGNIYKAKVVNVEPAIQAAFIEFGLERNGFLHISDLHPKYFQGEAKEQTERVGKKTPRRDRPPIQKCLRRGQDILVQVLKEGIGTKGPTLTSYLSIPGRFLVMMPDMERLGVSRKIDDEEIRRATRDLIDELKPPDGFGFIVRTAGIDRPKAELKRDLAFLQRLWRAIDQRMSKIQIGELYAESDLVVRTIRDVFVSDIERIIVDNEAAARRARDFLQIANPRSSSKVVLYSDRIPLFHRYQLEEQIEQINARTVALPSGGSLVIEQTEALVAIDVNSGKMRDNLDAETTAYKTNQEAADEICRQLRLRDLGGVIVNDLIDMRQLERRRAIELRFRENLKRDRARTRVVSISQLGILEMTRQRMRPSLSKSIHMDCPHCFGTGWVKSPESVLLVVMRRLALVLSHSPVAKVDLTVSPDVAFQLLNRKRRRLVELEQEHNKPVMVRVNEAGSIDFIRLVGLDERGGEVDSDDLRPPDEPDQKFVEETTTVDVEQNTPEPPEQSTQVSRRRRRRRSKSHASTPQDTDDQGQSQPRESAETDAQVGSDKPRRTRRSRGRRSKGKSGSSSEDNVDGPKSQGDKAEPDVSPKPLRVSRGYHNRLREEPEAGKTKTTTSKS